MRGYATIDEVFAPGMTAMAAPVMRRSEAIGVISIAGPRTRLTPSRMQALAPALWPPPQSSGDQSRVDVVRPAAVPQGVRQLTHHALSHAAFKI